MSSQISARASDSLDAVVVRFCQSYGLDVAELGGGLLDRFQKQLLAYRVSVWLPCMHLPFVLKHLLMYAPSAGLRDCAAPSPEEASDAAECSSQWGIGYTEYL